jgi:hypothetical protein
MTQNLIFRYCEACEAGRGNLHCCKTKFGNRPEGGNPEVFIKVNLGFIIDSKNKKRENFCCGLNGNKYIMRNSKIIGRRTKEYKWDLY